ncbi:hypothetical protein ACN47E_009908 [Coniothyrium glycines]
MSEIRADTKITPRIIIHGGAGNLTKQSLPREKYDAYQKSLLNILDQAKLALDVPGATALDVATYAVSLLEDDPLYNSGKGAVFTREGQNELECSIMTSNGYQKRGVGCMMLRHVKNPIKLARELLVRGEEVDGAGAGNHCQYSGPFVEGLAEAWGLEIVEPSYFFTQQRWDEHERGMTEQHAQRQLGLPNDEMADWEKANYIPLGTCGAVVLDSFGTICTATSTGGLTNKVPGRIGDTPTLGAGFWAEEWSEQPLASSGQPHMLYQAPSPVVSSLDRLSRGDVGSLFGDCFPSVLGSGVAVDSHARPQPFEKPTTVRHAVGLSGTGNGDAFLRTCAVRTAAARSRFAHVSLSAATTWMAGSGGELQQSAGERWGKTNEGTGGIIGIELVGLRGEVVFDFNCGGLFRAWVDEHGAAQCQIFKSKTWEGGPAGYMWG